MICWVAPMGAQIVTFRPRVMRTWVTVTAAWAASVWRDWPATLALEVKLASHSAASPNARGGMSAGGRAGSNSRLENVAGSFMMMGAAILGWPKDEMRPQPI